MAAQEGVNFAHLVTDQSYLRGGNSSSTLQWKDVPRGTVDEVSSYFRLDLPSH